MLKIGEFSKIAQVSIKTLRYYDRMGLFKPTHIDHYSGYRYYTLSQLPRLNRILALKDLDFSLDQVQELLNTNLSETALRKMLQSKSTELRQRIQDQSSRLLRVENRLQQLEEAAFTNLPVVMKSAPNLLIATVRQVIPTMDELTAWQVAALQEIRFHLHQEGEKTSGPDILIYHQDAFCDEDVDVEVGTVLREVNSSIEQNLS